ncbi:hypothetical protein MPSEU_000418200 [Mayamaea pseudoterrestris]|nr:hypothetical protein MPSEU_000418200 [Mayamaea pseudoterrestris]
MSTAADETLAFEVMMRDRIAHILSNDPFVSMDHDPVRLASSAAEVAPPPAPPPPISLRQRRRMEARMRRAEFRQRAQDRRIVNRNRRYQGSTCCCHGCYQSFCRITSILILPLIIMFAIIGVLLFGVFFCLPLLIFLLGLSCMYYCCTESPVPPRLLWRALISDQSLAAAAAAPETPPGLSLEQIQDLIVKRKCIGVETVKTTNCTFDQVWGVNLLKHQASEQAAYWPTALDNGHEQSICYLFSKPLSTSEIKLMGSVDEAEAVGAAADKSHSSMSDEVINHQLPRKDAAALLRTKKEETKEDFQDEQATAAAAAAAMTVESLAEDDHLDSKDEWTCTACTLANEVACLHCIVCLAPRPPRRLERPEENDNDMDLDAPFNLVERMDISSLGSDGNANVCSDQPTGTCCNNLSGPLDLDLHDVNKSDHAELDNDVKNIVYPLPPAYACSTSRHDEIICDICLGEYEEGDVVAWSKNVLCKHAFHLECISDWLIRRPTCPSCRQDYIDIPASLKNAAQAVSAANSLRAQHANNIGSGTVEMASAHRMGLSIVNRMDEHDFSPRSLSDDDEDDSVNLAMMFDDTDGSDDNL